MTGSSTGGDLGRSLTGDFGADDGVRPRGAAWTALALCVFVFACGAFVLLLVV